MTCLDRNRMALQAEPLLAYTRGLKNVLYLTGNAVPMDDHKEAKGVFDFDSSQLVATIPLMESGQDVGAKNLDGTIAFCAVRLFLRRLTSTPPPKHPPDLDCSLPLRPWHRLFENPRRVQPAFLSLSPQSTSGP